MAWNRNWMSKMTPTTPHVSKIFFFIHLFNSLRLYGFPVIKPSLGESCVLKVSTRSHTYGKPIVAIFNKIIFQFKESILVQFNPINLRSIDFIFGSTSNFVFKHFLHSIHFSNLQCDCFGSTFCFNFKSTISVQHFLFRSTLFIFVQWFIVQRLRVQFNDLFYSGREFNSLQRLTLIFV